MQREYEVLGRRLQLHLGDITRLEVDAIVSSENSDLIMDTPEGPSVSAAIRRAEGPALAQALARLGPIEPGRAVVTPAVALPCRWIVHAATVVKTEEGHQATLALVRAAVRSALALAGGLGLTSIAFPAFAVRAAELSVRRTSEAMVEEIVAGLQGQTSLRRVVIALLDPDAFLSFFEEALRSGTRATAPLVLRLERVAEALRASFPDDGPVARVVSARLDPARAADLRQRVARLRGVEGRRLLGVAAELAALGAEVWALLPAPVRERLAAEGERPLVLRLDAALAGIPFELAHDGAHARVERAPVARQLVLDDAPPPRPPAPPSAPARLEALVLAGDPRALPAARREAAGLVDLLWRRAQHRARPTLLAGPRATCAAVRDALRRSHLIHWCGHTEPGAAGPSWALADGGLDAAAIALLPLQARLVVANSCGGDEGALARAFLVAGARNVVGTLWEVDDAAADAFARPLYDALLRGETLGGALAAARAAARAADPLHWAAYVHYGDPRERLFEAAGR